ncbi:MAG: hypothetical protein AMJ60_11930 [Desulfobacterales bacterium SG8_35]|nr:MAG: hypothetical protein AMJ60_11930 [Desulfobacterales bacterium SG8_35]
MLAHFETHFLRKSQMAKRKRSFIKKKMAVFLFSFSYLITICYIVSILKLFCNSAGRATVYA